jgi:hypothetical protein
LSESNAVARTTVRGLLCPRQAALVFKNRWFPVILVQTIVEKLKGRIP